MSSSRSGRFHDPSLSILGAHSSTCNLLHRRLNYISMFQVTSFNVPCHHLGMSTGVCSCFCPCISNFKLISMFQNNEFLIHSEWNKLKFDMTRIHSTLYSDASNACTSKYVVEVSDGIRKGLRAPTSVEHGSADAINKVQRQVIQNRMA